MRQIGIGSLPQQGLSPAPALQAQCVLFKPFLYTGDNPSALQSCTANILFIPITFITAGWEWSDTGKGKERKKRQVSPKPFHMLQRRLCVCLYNTASHCSGTQNEEPPLTEGVSSVQDDRGCIHSATFRAAAL